MWENSGYLIYSIFGRKWRTKVYIYVATGSFFCNSEFEKDLEGSKNIVLGFKPFILFLAVLTKSAHIPWKAQKNTPSGLSLLIISFKVYLSFAWYCVRLLYDHKWEDFIPNYWIFLMTETFLIKFESEFPHWQTAPLLIVTVGFSFTLLPLFSI